MKRRLGSGCVRLAVAGRPLGDEEFVENLERRCGRRLPGPGGAAKEKKRGGRRSVVVRIWCLSMLSRVPTEFPSSRNLKKSDKIPGQN